MREQRNSEKERESGLPGGGSGRKDEVGRSGVYPMSGPHPQGVSTSCFRMSSAAALTVSVARQHTGSFVMMSRHFSGAMGEMFSSDSP
jgi:hypothetical protein